MKHAITLEKADLDALFSEDGFTLYFHDGQEVTLHAEGNGKPPPPAEKPVELDPPAVSVRRGRKKLRRGSRLRPVRRSPGIKARQAEKKEKFLQVLKETGDIKRAYKAAGVSDVTGYKWRKEAGLGEPKRRKSRGARLQFKPRRRDFVDGVKKGAFFCRPCDRDFPTLEDLQDHQVERHGMKISGG